jgi:glutathione synthase/RimK-type ligase-like ATP-grasp enzyme
LTGRPRVALATSSEYAQLSADDRLLLAPLGAHGVEAVAAVWNDPAVDWRAFDAVVLRSTWDYHLALPAFLRWIDTLEAAGVRLHNPPHVVRWNADKRYLLELAGRGVPVVPTTWVPAGGPNGLRAIAADHGWDRVVVKPAVSASAHGTWLSEDPITEADEARFRTQAALHGLLVQRFVGAVRAHGEWSLQFFAARYSHAVRKRPGPGDYRTQGEHGGHWAPEPAPRDVLGAATAVLAALPFPAEDCLYARVDGVEEDGAFLLMEVELVEPSLFLAREPGAAERFAAAIAARVAARR